MEKQKKSKRRKVMRKMNWFEIGWIDGDGCEG